jgi:hypothetical protein
MKNLKSFNEFVNESIVNEGYAKKSGWPATDWMDEGDDPAEEVCFTVARELKVPVEDLKILDSDGSPENEFLAAREGFKKGPANNFNVRSAGRNSILLVNKKAGIAYFSSYSGEAYLFTDKSNF